jgi:uroporphyrinogen-III synthase
MIGDLISAPMAGRRVWVTRPTDVDDPLPAMLQGSGAEVICAPTIAIDTDIDTSDLDRALVSLAGVDWVVFTSTRAVLACVDRLREIHVDRSALVTRRIAAVGPATAAALVDRGVPVTLVAEPHSAEGLIAALAARLTPGAVVLYPRARSVPPTLADGLRSLGAHVREVVAYQTLPAAIPVRHVHDGSRIDVVVFCSPSAVRAARPHRPSIERSIVACIGPSTEHAARIDGLAVHIVPPRATAAALADAIVAHFAAAAR